MNPAGLQPERWHQRLEARLAAVLGLLVAGALGAMLTMTTNTLARQSRARAAEELEAARTTFYRHLESRTESALAASQLIGELPVFRAHFTDARLVEDRSTMEAMADGYRLQVGAQFVVVTDAHGTWLASPGRTDAARSTPPALQRLIEGARTGVSQGTVIGDGGRLFLAVSSPARFADEILGTLTIGYQLTDSLVSDLAHVAQCELAALADGQIAASSLDGAEQAALGHLATVMSAGKPGVRDTLYRLGDREFVAGVFPLDADAATSAGQLVLLADWRPTQQFVEGLRQQFLAGGAVALTLALVVGLVVSANLSRSLREIASAAERVADGDLSLELPVRGSAEARTVALAFNDMSTRLRATYAQLEHDAIHDALTKLPNRVLLMERLDRSIARRAQDADYRFAVLFLDLDRFKHVNDSLGHAAGDELLVAFARRLAAIVRRTDVVVRADLSEDAPSADTLARFGGDEFVILLDDIREPIDAVRVAERVQRASTLPFVIGNEEIFVTASLGVAVSSSLHRTGGDVVRDADLAMYRAKSAGGASYALFDDAMHDAAVERLHLETELRRALERGELCLFYQPIVSLRDGRMKGVEALVRWRHPERGLLPPSAFLHVAEQMGVMSAIDDWALGEACRQSRVWRDAHPAAEPPTISVNLSTKAFGSPSLVARVTELLHASGVPASSIRLEVTEGVAMADPARTRTTLAELRALGVRVSLDDFGTGYCSLSYLQQFPVDTLKIDRTFVTCMQDGSGAEIVKLVVALAQTIGLEIVAEGTESAEQVSAVQQLGCQFGQGYYFSRPVAPDELQGLGSG